MLDLNYNVKNVSGTLEVLHKYRNLLVLAYFNKSVVLKISGAMLELFDRRSDVVAHYVDVSETLF